jgi:hypothetical protein
MQCSQSKEREHHCNRRKARQQLREENRAAAAAARAAAAEAAAWARRGKGTGTGKGNGKGNDNTTDRGAIVIDLSQAVNRMAELLRSFMLNEFEITECFDEDQLARWVARNHQNCWCAWPGSKSQPLGCPCKAL